MFLYELQRNPKNFDLTKSDLLQLLCQVEAELEAREIALAVLKVRKRLVTDRQYIRRLVGLYIQGKFEV